MAYLTYRCVHFFIEYGSDLQNCEAGPIGNCGGCGGGDCGGSVAILWTFCADVTLFCL